MSILFIDLLNNEFSNCDIKFLSQNFDLTIRRFCDPPQNKDLKNIKTIIQYGRPQNFTRYGPHHHIGYIDHINSISGHLENSLEFCNIVDELWVSTPETFEFLKKNNRISCPVYFAPHYYNLNFDKSMKMKIDNIENHYKFLFAGQKDLDKVIRAFYLEFNPTEPVSLLVDSNLDAEKINDYIKNELNLYKNKNNYQNITITKNASPVQKLCLYNYTDCYLNIGHEFNNWPLINCIGYNKEILSPYRTNFNILANYDYRVWINTFTNDNGGVFDELDLKNKMRATYLLNRKGHKTKEPINFLEKFNLETILERLKV